MQIAWLKFSSNFYLKIKEAKENISDLWSTLFLRVELIILMVGLALNWLLALIIKTNLKQELAALHYNIIFGIDLLGSPTEIYLLPLASTLMSLFNLVLILFFHRQDKFLSKLLLATSLVINGFIILAVYSIYLINFR